MRKWFERTCQVILNQGSLRQNFYYIAKNVKAILLQFYVVDFLNENIVRQFQ